MSGPDNRLRQWLRRLRQTRSPVGPHEPIVQESAALEVVQRSEQRFRKLLESLRGVAVQGYDRDRRVIYWNEASARLYGYSSEEASGCLLEDLIIPDVMRDGVVKAHRAWVEEGQKIPPGELELRHRSGKLVPVFSHHVMLNEHTDDPLLFCVDVDLSDQKRAHRELEFVTRFDHLTQLPNRKTVETQLDVALEECRRQGRFLMLVYLDVDRFGEFNDTLGYEQGDRLLVELAHRLSQGRREADLVARVSSDEFLLAFPGLRLEQDGLALVRQIEVALKTPFVLAGRRRKVTASLGVSVYPGQGGTAAELIRSADMAKNRAKLEGPGKVMFFDQQHHDELLHRHRLIDRLDRALDAGEMMLHYQPQVSVASGRIENLEVLLRWEPPDEAPVSPGEFIPLAEHSDLIHHLGDWTLEEACRQRARWRDAGLPVERLDINFSARQLSRPDIFRRFEACLQRHGLGPRHIGIELTENVLIEADVRVRDGLRHLHDRGFRIAIDDFGTGYSSLSYLKQFPVTALKIDRSFVHDAPDQLEDRAIMEATVFIGHRLGLEVVAEGVENGEQLALIREMRCDLVQGYYFFGPMPADEIERLLIGMAVGGASLSS